MDKEEACRILRKAYECHRTPRCYERLCTKCINYHTPNDLREAVIVAIETLEREVGWRND